MRALQVRTDQLVEALFGGVDDVAALALADAGVVHQQVETAEAFSSVCNQRFPVSRRRDIARKYIRAGLRVQALRRIAPSTIRTENLMCIRQFGRNRASDSPACAG